MKRRKWRLGFSKDEIFIQVQFKVDGEWLTQTQYEVVDGLISKDILDEISELIWLDYNNSYSVELDNDEIW